VTLSVGVCCSSPRADRVYYLGVGLFLALYIPLRLHVAHIVQFQTEPITLCDKVLSAGGKPHHPGGDPHLPRHG
jgi:hypothetical protein